MAATQNHYKVLGVETDSDFAAIKKAYYRRVKECHPDLFGGSKSKEEEFKILVLAFDILSDPDKRKKFDESSSLGTNITEMMEYVYDGFSIMDTDVDDTLEEFIVGNKPPENTSLATLFSDLQRTDVFITFREGKNYFAREKYRSALHFFTKAVELSPSNIIYRYYTARSFYNLKMYSKARSQYNAGIAAGKRRVPTQRLIRFQKELEELSRDQFSWGDKLISIFRKKIEIEPFYGASEEMIDETNKVIAKLTRGTKQQKEQKNNRKLLN